MAERRRRPRAAPQGATRRGHAYRRSIKTSSSSLTGVPRSCGAMNEGRLQNDARGSAQVLRPHGGRHTSTSTFVCERRIYKDLPAPFNRHTPSCCLVAGRRCLAGGDPRAEEPLWSHTPCRGACPCGHVLPARMGMPQHTMAALLPGLCRQRHTPSQRSPAARQHPALHAWWPSSTGGLRQVWHHEACLPGGLHLLASNCWPPSAGLHQVLHRCSPVWISQPPLRVQHSTG